MRYESFVELAERFAVDNDLIVGGPAATRLLLGDPENPSAPPPIDLGAFRYDFYGDRVSTQARDLGTALYELDPEGLGHYTKVTPKAAKRKYTISVDGRDLFTITALPSHRNIQTTDVVIPSLRPAQFTPTLQIPCMGPEIQLISLYATLCAPDRASEWGNLLKDEIRLRHLFNKEIRAKIAEATSQAKAGGSKHERRFVRALLENYVVEPGRVLVGPVAITLLTEDYLEEGRLQVVSAHPLDREAEEITTLAKARGIVAQYAVSDLKVPVDARLRRLTIYLVEGGGREPVMDVYNAASYELVPYVAAGAAARGPRRTRGTARRTWEVPAHLRVGTPFVQMRFRLVDMWTIQVLMRMKVLEPGPAKTILHRMLSDYETISSYYESRLADASVQLLPTTFAGRLEDPSIATLRREAVGWAPPPYFPAEAAGKKEAGGDSSVLSGVPQSPSALSGVPRSPSVLLELPRAKPQADVDIRRC